MGNWSKKYMNSDTLPSQCIVYAGTTRDELKNNILSTYTNVKTVQAHIFEGFVGERDDELYLLLFQIYGAAMMADVVHILADGNVKEILFIGAVHSFDVTLDIGCVIVPDQIQALDGLVNGIEKIEITYPDADSFSKVKYLLERNLIPFRVGKTVSIPAVFVKPEKEIYHKDTIALEMESSSLFHYAKKNSIKAAAIHVVSDNANHHLYEDQKKRYDTISRLSQILTFNNIPQNLYSEP
jgi:purine-nucleoside phosphorylase